MITERMERISRIVRSRGNLTVQDLASITGLSPGTVRRYLAALEDRGEVVRTHGGVTVAGDSPDAIAAEETFAAEDLPDAVIAGSGAPHDDLYLIRQYRDHQVPVISESEPVSGMTTRVCIDDAGAGYELGKWCAEYAREHLSEPLRVLDLTYVNNGMQERSEAFSRAIHEHSPASDVVVSVSAQEGAYQLIYDALHLHRHINVVFAANDLLAYSAVKACRALRIRPEKIAVVTVGLEDETLLAELSNGEYCKAGIAHLPEFVAATCLLSVLRTLAGEVLPIWTPTPHVLLTPANVSRWYAPLHGKFNLNWRLASETFSDVHWQIARAAAKLEPRHRHIRYFEPPYELGYFRKVYETLVELGTPIGVGVTRINYDLILQYENERRLDAITMLAVSRVRDGDVVVLGDGEISTRIAEHLVRRNKVTLITNSVAVFRKLKEADSNPVILVGGQYDPVRESLTGPLAESMMASLRTSWYFMEPIGITSQGSVMSTSAGEVPIVRAFMNSAVATVIVSDHLVFKRTGLLRICDLTEVTGIICDNAVPASTRVRIRELGPWVETTHT